MYKSKYLLMLVLIVLAVLHIAAPFIGAVSSPETSLAVPILMGISVCLGVFATGFVIVDVFRMRRISDNPQDFSSEDDSENDNDG